MRLVLAALALFVAPAAHASCEPAPDAASSWKDDVKAVLFWTGARALNVIDPSPAYPKNDAARGKRNEEIAKTVAKKKLANDPILADLRSLGVDDVDLFHGSHVVVEDGGALYEEW